MNRVKNGSLLNCKVCGREFYASLKRLRRGAKYCSHQCQGVDSRGRYLKPHDQLKNTYQITVRLRKEIGRCQACGLDDTRILTLHHKDGNHDNNTPSNWALLCPNCHSLAHVNIRGRTPIIPKVGKPSLGWLDKTKNCANCCVSFTTKTPKRKYCYTCVPAGAGYKTAWAKLKKGRICSNGHHVFKIWQFCPTCGVNLHQNTNPNLSLFMEAVK